jgi:hypothetical protein
MGKHKKNKPTPKPEEPTKRDVFTDFTNPLTPEKIFEVEKEEKQNLIVDVSQLPENDFKEEEKIVENLQDMPLPLGDIDPVEMRPEREENESSEDYMQKLKEQGKTLVEDDKQKEPVKSGRISFSEMLRNRRKSTKRN